MNQYLFIAQLEPCVFGFLYSKDVSAELECIMVEMHHCQIFCYPFLKQVRILSLKNGQHQFGLVGYVNVGISISVPIPVFITIYILAAWNIKIDNGFTADCNYLWRKIWTWQKQFLVFDGGNDIGLQRFRLFGAYADNFSIIAYTYKNMSSAMIQERAYGFV